MTQQTKPIMEDKKFTSNDCVASLLRAMRKVPASVCSHTNDTVEADKVRAAQSLKVIIRLAEREPA